MRSLKPFNANEESPIVAYAARIAETAAVRRARAEARMARAEAERLIKARSEFLSNMNHELRTPLNAIIGFATMMHDTDQYDLQDDQRKLYTEYILQSGDLLLGHINTILEVAALDGEAIELYEENFDIGDTLRAVVNRAKTAASVSDVKLELLTSKNNPPIIAWGDKERVGQALDHVIRTAIKTSEEGGRVVLRGAVGAQGRAEIAIRDYGRGFSQEQLENALNAFNDLHRGLDKSFAASGIGLAIAKTFIEMQGGEFSLKSQLGEGCLTRINLHPAREKGNAMYTEQNSENAIEDDAITQNRQQSRLVG